MKPFDPKSIFSQRVENYIRFRPGYPIEVLDVLREECGLAPSWRVADIGSGTGLLSRLFLNFGCEVFGIEPNDEMRLAGNQLLADFPRFHGNEGSAEDTGLAESSVELVTAGMAFHWFDIPRARAEFLRILTPGGWVALVWNRILPGPNPFMRAFTDLVHAYSPGWTETQRRDQPGNHLNLPGFFHGDDRPAGYERLVFPHQQEFDWEGLLGRTTSIAHAPQPGAAAFQALSHRLRAIYDRFQRAGQVAIQYETELYYGQLQ